LIAAAIIRLTSPDIPRGSSEGDGVSRRRRRGKRGHLTFLRQSSGIRIPDPF